MKVIRFFGRASEQYIVRWPGSGVHKERLDIRCQSQCGSHLIYIPGPSGCSTCDIESNKYGLPPCCNAICDDTSHGLCSKERRDGMVIMGCRLDRRYRLHLMVRKLLLRYHNKHVNTGHSSFFTSNIILPETCLTRQ